MENFINGLDNNSCAVILENLLFNVDSRDCARKLDNLLESYQFKHETRQLLSRSTIDNARDAILMKEGTSNVPDPTDFTDQKSAAQEIIRLIKIGGISLAIGKLTLMKPSERQQIIDAIGQQNKQLYSILISNPILARFLPNDVGFAGRVTKTAWTFGKQNVLNPADKQYLNSIGKFAKGTALVAAGIVTAIIGINLAYKHLFSAEARKCNGMTGKKRTICMCNAIITAAESAQKKAEESLLQCDQSNDPQECRYKMKVEIRSWMKKIEEQKRKLARLQVNKQPYPNERPDKSKTSDVPVGDTSDPFGDDTSQNNLPQDPFA